MSGERGQRGTERGQSGARRAGQRGAHRAPPCPRRSQPASPLNTCSSTQFILFSGTLGCDREMWGQIPFLWMPWVPRCGGHPAPGAAGEDALAASAGSFPARCPSCQEIPPRQEMSFARNVPPCRPLPPPSSLPTHTQPRRAHRRAISQPAAQLRFKQQQSHQNGFVWRKVYKEPGLPDARLLVSSIC